MNKLNTILVDKYFEYSCTRGLNGKQMKMLQILSKELCKIITQDIIDEISGITMGFLLGSISKEEVDIRIEGIRNKILREKKCGVTE